MEGGEARDSQSRCSGVRSSNGEYAPLIADALPSLTPSPDSDQDDVETGSLSADEGQRLSDSQRSSIRLPKHLHKEIQSFDYDSFESRVNLQHEQDRTEETLRLVAVGRWIMTFFIGMMTACSAIFIETFVHHFATLKWNLVGWASEQEQSGQLFFGSAFCILLGIASAYVVFASYLVAKVCPVAGGSGIPEIKATLNGIKIPQVVRFKTLFAKVAGVLFSVASGLPCGKEGPMIHSGAIMGAGLSQGKSTSFGVDTSFSKFNAFRNDKEKRDFIACGAAAGVAAAFGAPIGGVLFSLEEGASFWHSNLTWRTFFCAMISAFTLNTFLTYNFGNHTWGYLGSQAGTFTFGPFNSARKEYVAWELFIFICMGVGGGLLGAIFNGVNTSISKFRMRYMSDWRVKMLQCQVVIWLVVAAQFWIPFYFGTCLQRPDLSDTKTNSTMSGQQYTEELVTFYCGKDTEYNDLASIFFVPSDVAIKQLLHYFSMDHSTNVFMPLSLVLFLAPYYLLACVTYGISVPSGLFVPSLLAGAAYGRICAWICHVFGIPTVANDGIFALVGAASMLGGMARMTISLTVIILECTGVMEWGLPLMLSLMAARWAGNYFNEGLYDIHIHLKKLPFLEFEPPFFSKFLRVKHVASSNIHVIDVVTKAGVLYDLLYETNNSAYPVVLSANAPLQDSTFSGIMLRKHLCILLQRKDFFAVKPEPFTRQPAGRATFLYNQQYSLSYQDMEGTYPRYPYIDSIDIRPEERDLWLDLSPYLNPTPYLIQDETPLPRAFRLFRSLGLRHLVVVDHQNHVTGIITRKDLTPWHIKYSLSRLSEEEKQKVQWYIRRQDPTRNLVAASKSERDLLKDINSIIRTPRAFDDESDRPRRVHFFDERDNDDAEYAAEQEIYFRSESDSYRLHEPSQGRNDTKNRPRLKKTRRGSDPK